MLTHLWRIKTSESFLDPGPMGQLEPLGWVDTLLGEKIKSSYGFICFTILDFNFFFFFLILTFISIFLFTILNFLFSEPIVGQSPSTNITTHLCLFGIALSLNSRQPLTVNCHYFSFKTTIIYEFVSTLSYCYFSLIYF